MPDRDFIDLIVTTAARPPTIVMGSPGWGTQIIANFDRQMKTFLYTGLLAAKLDVQVLSAGEVTLFTLTDLSYHVWVDRLLVFRRGTNPVGGFFSMGSNASIYNNWNDSFVFTNLVDDDKPIEIIPTTGGSEYSNTIADVIGMVNNEDSPFSNSFRVKHTSFGGMAAACDFYVYGSLIRRGV